MRVTLLDCMGTDLSVVNAARVSFGKSSDWFYTKHEERVLSPKDQKLIKYLGEHGHYSPFGHCFLSFHVKAPIFVARQLVKHKFLRWNEISRRYVEEPPEFYHPNFRYSTKDRKQGSGTEVSNRQQEATWFDFDRTETAAYNSYMNAIEEGIAPEQARIVLPQSTYTEWYWSGSLDAFANMCNLRCKGDTQQETREVANQVDSIIKQLYPWSWKALRDEGN